MTSIRSFSEILRDDRKISAADRKRFVSIIHDESLRLTRLLDEILDINRLESGGADLKMEAVPLYKAISSSLDAISGMTRRQRR